MRTRRSIVHAWPGRPWWLIPLAIIAARQWRRRGWQHDRAARGWR